KFSRPIDVHAKLYDFEGRGVLAFYVSPATRFDKPVKVKADRRWETYIRLGGGDHRCTAVEEARFLRDASHESYDSVASARTSVEDLDASALQWFRDHLARRNPEWAYPGLDPAAYLGELGLVRDEGELTNAAVLMFGKDRLLARVKPGGVVDFRVHHSSLAPEAPDERWDDRELCERNLVATLRSLLERLRRLIPQPFAVDSRTGERRVDSPDYISIREALVNLLIHQDYSDRHRTARILWYQDATLFENPGDSFAELRKMLDGGTSELRNPLLVRLLRQAGFAEQAGTGIPKIVRTWRGAQRIPPSIDNDPGQKLFRLTLDWRPLKSQRDEAWYRKLGVEIDENGSRLLTYGREHGAFDVTKARLVTGLPGREAVRLVSQLVTQQLLAADEVDGTAIYSLAPHLQEIWAATPAPRLGRSRKRGRVTEGVTEGVNGGVTEGVSEGVSGGVNEGGGLGKADRTARLEAVIRAQPGLRLPQLAEAAELPEKTAERYLAQLRKAGRVVYRGAPRTGGYFPDEPRGKGPARRRDG
ncbi:MAG TPA: ATP-binding protein, partial [Thermoanaerobaculia bacterium]|nr:ATP-binding protein [Thermoanaerobaculia bacterium]